jgi:hypothetical protein
MINFYNCLIFYFFRKIDFLRNIVQTINDLLSELTIDIK